MRTPKLTQVSFHPSYAVHRNRGEVYFEASMTALDSAGKVWRTFQNPATGGWQPWAPIDTFDL